MICTFELLASLCPCFRMNSFSRLVMSWSRSGRGLNFRLPFALLLLRFPKRSSFLYPDNSAITVVSWRSWYCSGEVYRDLDFDADLDLDPFLFSMNKLICGSLSGDETSRAS